ncbi:glycosyl transferase [Leptolyngbya sp. 'hensonii']|uniref:glycosyltransferase family 4 protein n=1 Tax=Leptolyngbya sp. 'hensonii' TaxID=1922337 RepID=UPI00094FBF20|nr:glycosyltransferase family 4 protein [Leptolyngbya sp. 'hensonii']OLP20476.1 glycosyl transferase [Leptolyngbya sp. 'hensonii']
MKVLHLSTSDLDGGAARAAYRLHQGLQSTGITSQMLVRAKSSLDKTIVADKTLLTRLGPPSTSLPLRFYPHRDRTMFSGQWFPDAIAPKVRQLNPDIVQLHWICNGFLQLETLAKLNKPLVWTLHDMWPLTGGCHYSGACDRYHQTCGACPQLKSSKEQDLSRWVWQRKVRAWKNLPLTIVSPSVWLAECARSSSLFHDRRIEVIPHGLDLTRYRPIDRAIARDLLQLSSEQHIVLFGASPGTTSDPRKGLQFLQPAIQKLGQSGWQDRLQLVVFGSSRPEQPIDLGFPIHYLGQFQDDIALALVYSAADVMVVPSIQEAFGQTASEALACGTPVVAFGATGLQDIVDHQQNGYLARPFEVDDLAQGIAWVLEDKERHEKLCFHAREKAEKVFTLELQASRHRNLYREILENKIS